MSSPCRCGRATSLINSKASGQTTVWFSPKSKRVSGICQATSSRCDSTGFAAIRSEQSGGAVGLNHALRSRAVRAVPFTNVLGRLQGPARQQAAWPVITLGVHGVDSISLFPR